jgi:hypothetical protein
VNSGGLSFQGLSLLAVEAIPTGLVITSLAIDAPNRCWHSGTSAKRVYSVATASIKIIPMITAGTCSKRTRIATPVASLAQWAAYGGRVTGADDLDADHAGRARPVPLRWVVLA